MRRKGFTLMEVLIATAIAGMVIAASFRLIAMSYRLLGELQSERDLIAAAQEVWMRFRTDPDTPDNGTDDDMNIKWYTEKLSVPVDEDYELNFRRVIIEGASGRTTEIYIPESKTDSQE